MDRQYPRLTKLALGVLGFNSALAIYNSWRTDDRISSIAFVLAADAILLLLFLCLREFEQQQGGHVRGRRDATKIRAAVWCLTTLLTAMFASRVAPLMSPVVGAVVWVMAVATAGGGFWACFLT